MLQSAIVGLADDGAAYALLASCLILVYRTTGVPNFAIAAVGTMGTFIASSLNGQGMNLALATVIGVVCGGLISLICGFIFVRYFFDAPPAYRAAVAIALMIAIAAITIHVFTDQPRMIPTVVAGSAFTLDGVVVSGTNLAGLLLALCATVFITGTLNRSRRGLQLRAISQGPVAAELLGLPVRPLVLATWGGSGALGTLAILAIAPGISSEVQSMSLLVVPALAATLIAAFRRYWLAFVSGLVLGAAQGLMSYSQTLIDYIQVIPFAVILGVLIWNQRKEVWDEAR
jgi:branched-chain amino acid transport system permease protein